MVNEGGPHRHAVLVVEDDHDARESFILLAESVALDAVGAENGRVALGLLRNGLRPCLIVLDIAMPEIDGFEFRRQQMADPALAHLAIAVMSGGGWATEADARKLGLTLFFRKPIEPEELLRAFVDHCGARTAD